MKLRDIVQGTSIQGVIGPTDREITDLCYHSEKARPGSLFVAIAGTGRDGHRYIAEALDRGASAVALLRGREREVGPRSASFLVYPDTRAGLAELACNFFGHPSRELGTIGVTGTNGKTTVTYLIESILLCWGKKVGVVGTVNYRYGGMERPALTTTPESADLQRLMRDMREAGSDWTIMEVSSHALDMGRVAGCHFDCGVFTSFSQDHLDYHGDMKRYFRAKARLFEEILPRSEKANKFAVLNGDDPKGREIERLCRVPSYTYGLKRGSTARLVAGDAGPEGIRGRIETEAGPLEFRSRLAGEFNFYNVLAACAVGVKLDIPLEVIAAGVEGLAIVPGRFERVEGGSEFTVLVDYAHTPDALERALKSARAICAGRLISVFGCGGNRDRGKRPQMGRASGMLADLTIVTSDNPRFEEPEAIIGEVIRGLEEVGIKPLTLEEFGLEGRGSGYLALADRRRAITLAINSARRGDLVLIAGKGHEDYQIIGDRKVHFDDREEARAAVSARYRESEPLHS